MKFSFAVMLLVLLGLGGCASTYQPALHSSSPVTSAGTKPVLNDVQLLRQLRSRSRTADEILMARLAMRNVEGRALEIAQRHFEYVLHSPATPISIVGERVKQSPSLLADNINFTAIIGPRI